MEFPLNEPGVAPPAGVWRTGLVRGGTPGGVKAATEADDAVAKAARSIAPYRALRDHPVPLLESAIRQLNNRSMALDLYVWLAYRLHSLGRPTAISWTSLHAQFGAGFKLVRQFKPQFLDALAAATAAYPDARVGIGESGIALHPSRPPVPKLA